MKEKVFMELKQILDEWVKIMNKEQIKLREEIEQLKNEQQRIREYLKKQAMTNSLFYKRIFYLENNQQKIMENIKNGQMQNPFLQ